MSEPVSGATTTWVRLHPLTPLLRGGRFALAALAVIGQQGFREGSMFGREAVAAFAASVLIAVLVGYLSWRSMRYRLTATELEVESGVLTKRSRRVPLAQVEAVDVVRPFYARVLGLAELRLEVVGGGDSEAPLSFLSDGDALLLRSRLLELTSGRRPAEGQEDRGAEPREHLLVSVPTGPLLASILLGPPLVAGVILVPVVVVAAVVGDLRGLGGVLLAAGPVLLGVASVSVRRFLAEYGSTVAESADGLRLRSGLLDTRSQTIPVGRIQTVRVLEPLLWRPFGWVRVEVDVAGYGATRGEEQAATSALLPVAPQELADALVARVLGSALPPPGEA
ncbi:MAG: putative rane protein, partial [Frankiales bacterium]|nr:putative rane protein [Frankiales bacterium]